MTSRAFARRAHSPRAGLVLASLLVFAACGCGPHITVALDDDDERELPAGSDPGLPGPAPDLGPPPDVIDLGAPPACCPVSFALRDPDGFEDEVSVTLRGSAPPLDEEGVALTFADGAWHGSACIPLDYVGYYYYELGFAGDLDPESTFYVTAVNEHVPLTTSALIDPVNAWIPLSSCADDVSIHADATTNP
ncbi:MAG: hypothetical protein R3B40_25385 [Polyangiales bacterium]|nr:hypothetical protein [Myxococcales bacterium]MCB9656940.1 hypothetical protein [Sandaracinaceae bacterium]